jgi:hypothetical protein
MGLNLNIPYNDMALILLPESSREEYEDSHDFETSHEHEQTEHPLDIDR